MTTIGHAPSAARHRRLRLGLIVVTVALGMSAILCAVLALRYQREMIVASRYNGTFDLEQTSVELLRLQAALADGGTPQAVAPIRMRQAILANRAQLLGSYTWGFDLDLTEVSGDLRQVLADIAPMIERLPDPAAAAEARSRLEPLVRPMLQLASRAHSTAGDAVAANQAELVRLFGLLSAVITGLVLFGAGLILFVLRQNERLDRLARTDTLTGIANRLAFNECLARPAGEQALVLVDVDHFKTLNDTLGHDGGDRLLRELSARLSAAAGDAGVIARIGGDEFGLLFDGPGAGRRASLAATGVVDAMLRPFHIENRDVRASVTLGVSATTAGEAATPAMLLENADIALYAAKAAGRNRCISFDPALKRDFVRRQRLREDLFTAVARGELHLAFQPIVDLEGGRVAGYEALLRWRHPTLGDISPAEFVPIAEESGEIRPIGFWVLREACRAAAGWPKDVFVAVNVSARQLVDDALVAQVGRCIAEHGLGRGRLEIEVTESILIGNAQLAFDVLERVRALGCRIALDDFGTGYASLGYLGRFPLDKLKIDRVFLQSSREDAPGLAIAKAICGLAAQLRLTVVAEGVETPAHLELVRAMGCDLGQGYLFGRPAASPVFAAPAPAARAAA